MDDWIAAGGEQGDAAAQSEGDHARATVLFESIEQSAPHQNQHQRQVQLQRPGERGRA